jgi:hypothetical protein
MTLASVVITPRGSILKVDLESSGPRLLSPSCQVLVEQERSSAAQERNLALNLISLSAGSVMKDVAEAVDDGKSAHFEGSATGQFY